MLAGQLFLNSNDVECRSVSEGGAGGVYSHRLNHFTSDDDFKRAGPYYIIITVV